MPNQMSVDDDVKSWCPSIPGRYASPFPNRQSISIKNLRSQYEPHSQSATQYRDDPVMFPTLYRVRFRFAKLSDANQLKHSPESWRPNNYIENIVASEIADDVLYIYTNCPTAYSLLLDNQGASVRSKLRYQLSLREDPYVVRLAGFQPKDRFCRRLENSELIQIQSDNRLGSKIRKIWKRRSMWFVDFLSYNDACQVVDKQAAFELRSLKVECFICYGPHMQIQCPTPNRRRCGKCSLTFTTEGEHCARTCDRDPRCIHCGEDHAAWQCDSEAAPSDVIAMREKAKGYQGMIPQWYQFHLQRRAISSITPPSLPLASTKKGTNKNKRPTGPVKTGPIREDTTQLTIVEMLRAQPRQRKSSLKPATPVRDDTPVPSGLTSESFNPVLPPGLPSVMGQSEETAALGNTDEPMAADQLACSADQKSSTIGMTSREPSRLAGSTRRVAQKHRLSSLDRGSDATVDKLKKPAAKKRRTKKTEGGSAESTPAKKRGRGRPPGSKNKTKLKDTPCTQLPFTPRPTPRGSSPSSAPVSSSCPEPVHAATLLANLTLSLSPPQSSTIESRPLSSLSPLVSSSERSLLDPASRPTPASRAPPSDGEPTRTRSGLVPASTRVDESIEPSRIVQEPTIKCHALISKEAVSPRAMPAIVKGHDEPQGPRSPVVPSHPLGFDTGKILRKQTGTIH
ncbi:hypothetical protein F4680DRAFT_452355 [Xylaria scruposa]|nr:hypothetical protein F4680DRAFT_452355 [Xylaria scruposa]